MVGLIRFWKITRMDGLSIMGSIFGRGLADLFEINMIYQRIKVHHPSDSKAIMDSKQR
jgi:hypothetical protein